MNGRRRRARVVPRGAVCLAAALCLTAVPFAPTARADGIALPRKLYKGQPYEGSIEERSQEAIIVFQAGTKPGEAREDVILKVHLAGDVDEFVWVVPFPSEPEMAPEEDALFGELHKYVETRLEQLSARSGSKNAEADTASLGQAAPAAAAPVEVLARKVVGSYDIAVVRENEEGALGTWLDENGYRAIEGGEEVIDFYRQKGYVFACIKVSEAELKRDATVELHPLRFSFATGGRDGIYFPMKLSGLQREPFDVNLYVFYGKWLNDHLSKFGYEHRGFRLKYRDWDTPACQANAGKSYSAPARDPFLKPLAARLPQLTKLLQKLHPGERYYLTNIQARQLAPGDVRHWSDDLWLFPYYTDRRFVPYDARPGGPAAAAWPGEQVPAAAPRARQGGGAPLWLLLGGFTLLVALLLVVRAVQRRAFA